MIFTLYRIVNIKKLNIKYKNVYKLTLTRLLFYYINIKISKKRIKMNSYLLTFILNNENNKITIYD